MCNPKQRFKSKGNLNLTVEHPNGFIDQPRAEAGIITTQPAWFDNPRRVTEQGREDTEPTPESGESYQVLHFIDDILVINNL